MEALILNIAGDRPDAPVVPRRIRLEVVPGRGRLILPDSPSIDSAGQASLANAWAAARDLCAAHGLDGRLMIASSTPITGVSAGASFGLLAVSALLERPGARPFFATGGVLDAQGSWIGGAAAARKYEAAKGLAEQLGWAHPIFLRPPLAEAVAGTVGATDLGSAFARLEPEEYPRIRDRHVLLRHAKGRPGTVGLDVRRPFALVSGPAPPSLPSDIGGVQVRCVQARGDALTIDLGERERVLWSTTAVKGVDVGSAIPRLLAMAKADSCL